MTTPPPSSASPHPDLWKVGDLATHTGLSVRTLHYYEEIGILVPSYRTTGDHRLYTKNDITRLQQIVSLKQMGMPLDTIKMMLEQPTYSPIMTLQMQMQRMGEQLQKHQELLERLKGLMRFLKSHTDITAEEFLRVIALMNEMEAQYTDEEKAELQQRAQALGDDGMRKAEQQWRDLIAAVQTHRDKGTDPKDPAMRNLAKQWMELVKAFSGGNPQIEAKLQKMYEEHPDTTRHFGYDPALFAYVQKALEP